MALVAIPQAGLTVHINHGDGSLGPCDASGGPGALGMMTITVTNAGVDASNYSAVIGLLLSASAYLSPATRSTAGR